VQDLSAVRAPWQDRVQKVMEGRFISTFMSLITLYVLYGTDVYQYIRPGKEGDRGLFGFSFACMILFFLELVANLLTKKGPPLPPPSSHTPGFPISLFSFLDLLALISLIPDSLQTFGIEVLSTRGLTVARAGRAARAGTR
jgi:hypothetical protein